MNYADLANKIHSNAVDKGFWDKQRDLDEMLMLAVSELAEGLEEHRDGKPSVYFKHNGCRCATRETLFEPSCHAKPEGLAVELADCIIRCLDTLASLTNNVTRVVEDARAYGLPGDVPTLPSARLFRITQCLARASDGGEPRPLWIAVTVILCEQMILALDENPLTVIETKMNYNSTRPYKHGKKY